MEGILDVLAVESTLPHREMDPTASGPRGVWARIRQQTVDKNRATPGIGAARFFISVNPHDISRIDKVT